MAKATAKKSDITYILELSEREANALTELLIVVDVQSGEGKVLDDIYNTLCEAGTESEKLFHEISHGEVIITRSSS